MSVGALAGFESASVFAGECRRPARDLPLSVMFSAPLIAATYILGTGAMLAYVPPDKIDLAAPLPQLMQAGFGNSGLGEILTLITVGALTLNTATGAIAMVGMTARFPMVIGWDGIFPHWWTRLHPRFRTPVRGLAAVTGGCILVALVSSWGAGGQEIFQIGTSAAVASLCVMYSLLFAVVLFGKSLPHGRPPLAIRLAGLSGLTVALLSLPLQIVPLTGVPNPAVFAWKVGGLSCSINALGAWLYWRGTRNRVPVQL
jgi:amino acid transporter